MNTLQIVPWYSYLHQILKIILPAIGLIGKIDAQNVSATWGANGNSAWYTGGNWSGALYAGTPGAATSNSNVATFTNTFTATTVGINMGTASLNLGALVVDNTRVSPISVGNSSGTAGSLRLYGTVVSGVSNVILSNSGTGTLTLQAAQNGIMGVSLENGANNIISIETTGGIIIPGVLSGSGSLIRAGVGAGVLTLSNASNTYTGKTIINSGFINITDEAVLGVEPGTFTSDQVTLNGGGIQVNTGNLSFNSNRGITIEAGGGIFDVGGASVISLQNSVSGPGDISKSGLGTLQLNKIGDNTFPVTSNVIINSGTVQISSDQTINDLSLLTGNLLVDNGVTLTINGTFNFNKPGTTITFNGTGKIEYGPAGILKYSGSPATTADAEEWPVLGGPVNIDCNNSMGVLLPFKRVITGSLLLSTGTFTIGAGALLDLDGASLSTGGGNLAGSNTGDLTVRGITGGVVTIPTISNITLRAIEIGGTRTLAMNGINHINLSGALTILVGATFDNGGESQLLQNGTGSIDIAGTFITRDPQGFTGSNTSIPGIVPLLKPNCTVQYGRTGNQSISIRSDYQNLLFTGGGLKTHVSANSITPIAGTVTISDGTTLNVANNTFGGANTNLSMTNARFQVSGTGPKPDIDGVYNLSANSVIEYSNSGTAANETIKGKNGAGVNILYDQIEITGNKVGNSNSNITLNTNGIFRVKTGGVFEINDNSITAAPSTAGQSVVLDDNATFLCGNNQGFNGFTATFTDNSSINSSITANVLAPGSIVKYTSPADQPITVANGIEYGNLTLTGGGIKTSPSGILPVRGDMVIAGASAFEPNGGTVLLNGIIQSIAGLTYNNLLITNEGVKTLSGNVTIIDSLKIGNLVSNPATVLELGNFDLTLSSTASQTARVGIVAPAAGINYSGSGRFNVERFFKPLRAWRMITMPLTSKGTIASSIFDTWQNGGVYETGKGMFITGPGAANPLPGPDGLDWSGQNGYSLKRFAKNKYSGVGKTKDSLISGNLTDTSANVGYFAFVRGDRSRMPNNTVVPNTNPTVLSARGKLQTGRQTFHVNTDSLNSFTLIGNPYPCPVDFNLVTKNNIYPQRFIVYDPTINGVGVFVIMEDGGSGVFAPTNVISTQDNFIQSGQAFLVQPLNLAAAADLVFNESNKSVNNNNATLFRPLGDPQGTFKMLLNKRYDSDSTSLADGVQVQLSDSYSNNIDMEDAFKFDNISENLSLLSNRRLLCVEKRQQFKAIDTLFYRLTNTTQRGYQFEFRASAIAAPSLVAYLEDLYTGIPVSVSFSGTTKINFDINKDEKSAAPDRFRLIFKTRPIDPIITLKAWQKDGDVVLEWSAVNELDSTRYDVEKSTDGINFKLVGASPIKTINNNGVVYSWLDTMPWQGKNYYRITGNAGNNRVYRSKSAIVKVEEPVPAITIYPNPVIGGVVNFRFENMPEGMYRIKFINKIGQVIFTKMIHHVKENSTEIIKITRKTVPGIYQIEVTAPAKKAILVKAFIN